MLYCGIGMGCWGKRGAGWGVISPCYDCLPNSGPNNSGSLSLFFVEITAGKCLSFLHLSRLRRDTVCVVQESGCLPVIAQAEQQLFVLLALHTGPR